MTSTYALQTHLSRAMADVKPGDHLCCLYETEEEHRAFATSFLRQGLEKGEKVLYIVDAHTADVVLGHLKDDGLETEPYLRSGQLSFLTADDAYVRYGTFSPDKMIAFLRTETEHALTEGYAALRVTGEMTWVRRGLPGSERLTEHESELNAFLPGNHCTVMCQYDRRLFSPAVLLDVLATHPVAIVGTEVYDNFYYIPPADFVAPDRSAATLGHWLENLAERKRTEKELRESHDALETRVQERTMELARANDILQSEMSERQHVEEQLKQSLERWRAIMQEMVQSLASTIEMRDPYTSGHERRVAKLATAIAKEMGLPKQQIDGIEMAADIHDIGKIYAPAEFLGKPGRLSGIELDLIKTHPEVGYEILKKIEFPWPIAQIVLQHHERMDGSGYPLGLRGEEILLEARIIAVADVVEAMGTHRPYRPALGVEKALDEISRNKGILYDPQVVDACMKIFAEIGLWE